MTMASHLKHLVGAATTIALLSSCANGSSAGTTPLTFQQNQSRAGKHATSCPCLYVTNQLFTPQSVTVYAAGAMGNAKPIQTIAGSNTGLNNPYDVAVDADGDIYVVNGNNSVTVYAGGATGNVAPMQTISGSNTGLNLPLGIALDPVNGDIYVANAGEGASTPQSVTIYAPGATGNVAPIGTIEGANTGLSEPAGLVLDASGNIYVPNLNNGQGASVTVYAAGATGNVVPMRTISGSRTKLNEPIQLALDGNGNINVVNHFIRGSVTVYAAGAHGNVRPIRTIKGAATKLNQASGIALDSDGNTYVASNGRIGDSSVTVYAAGANGNTAPINIIKGRKTGLTGGWGIAIR